MRGVDANLNSAWAGVLEKIYTYRFHQIPYKKIKLLNIKGRELK